jgi:malonate-semialdehyde dehydrogenase (acetylating)/methylmalonate-semialdehyde dehydrogenase
VTQEQGKLVSDADLEVGRGIEVVELAASAPSLLKGEVLPQVARDVETSMLRVPLGVVAGITSFNFPAMIPLWMIPLAVVTGNAFVLKPSERTPVKNRFR